MTTVQHAQTLFKQFLHNLGEANWASRHVGDRGPESPDTPKFYISDLSVSSLSVALGQMGLVRQVQDSSLYGS